MAFTTKAAVEGGVAKGEADIQTIENLCGVGGAIDKKLRSQIELLEKREKAFLRAFGCETFQELNKKLDELRNAESSINNLSGEALSRTFLNSARRYMYQTGVLGTQDAKLEKMKQDFIRNVIFELNSGANRLAKPKIDSTVQQLIFSLLHDLGSGVSLRSSSGLKGSIKFKGDNLEEVLEQIVINEITPIARQRIQEFNNKYPNSFSLSSSDNPIIISSTQEENLASITKNMLEKEVIEKLKNGKMSEEQFQKIQTDVINYVIARGPHEDPVFQEVVREVLTKADKHIFFGRNLINGYTGLLGEIQANYYLKKLGIDSKRKSSIEWKGGSREDGWEPSEDLMLQIAKSRRGIQVKNTAKDIIEPINFSDNVLSNLDFSSLGIPGVDNDIASILEPIYEMYVFNIEVIRNEEGKWVPGANEDFSATRGRVEALYTKANRALAMLAAAMMKMSVGKNSSEGNVAYLVGGSSFVSASDTLIQILGEINKNDFKKFQISAYFSKKGVGGGTIADVYNSHNSNAIPEKIKIRSSYQF